MIADRGQATADTATRSFILRDPRGRYRPLLVVMACPGHPRFPCIRIPIAMAGSKSRQPGPSSSAVAPSRETLIAASDRLSSVVSERVASRGGVAVGRDRLTYLRAIRRTGGGSIRQRQDEAENDQDCGADRRSAGRPMLSMATWAHRNLPLRDFAVQSLGLPFGSESFDEMYVVRGAASAPLRCLSSSATPRRAPCAGAPAPGRAAGSARA